MTSLESVPYKVIITCVFLGFALLEWSAHALIDRSLTRPRDLAIELIATISITAVTIPGVLFLVDAAGQAFAPTYRDALAHLPAWAMVAILLIADDMTQYWWHRTSHASPTLYNLHRAHHTAAYMSVRIVYRNNLFYYWLMPGLWFSAALIYLGFGPVYVVYAIVKMSVIIAAHSSVPWDAWLYRHRLGAKLMWLLERTISTPATHSAHHGKHASDGVTHYHGNYGNLLFFWDIVFGTAHISRRYPEHYGVEQERERSWRTELLWPLFRD